MFTNPLYLWTLAILPFIVIFHFFTLKSVKKTSLRFSNFDALQRVLSGDFLDQSRTGYFGNKDWFVLILRVFVYTLLIFSVSGTVVWYVGESSNFDFVIAFDTSSSMVADDLSPNRLAAAKEAAFAFVDVIPSKSNVSLVSFASAVFIEGEHFNDLEDVKKGINSITFQKSGGTNLGDAIVTSTNLLRSDKSKVIVLLTDGRSNVGIPIESAIEYALSKNVMIYTIGIGTEEGGRFLDTNISLDIISRLDEESLKNIAEATNGKYFRATNLENLNEAFTDIASHNKEIITFDISWILLMLALILLATEWILMYTIYKTVS